MMAWTDQDLERHLAQVRTELEWQPSATLITTTRERFARRGLSRGGRVTLVATLVGLLLLPAGLKAAETFWPGLRVEHFLGSLDDWLLSRDWGFGEPPSPGVPKRLSPEETAAVAHFAIRTPSWLPEGYEPEGEPTGYYANVLVKGLGPARWEAGSSPRELVIDQFFSALDRPRIQISQRAFSLTGEVPVELKAGDEVLQIAGHQAVWKQHHSIEANAENEARIQRGEPPLVANSRYKLTVYVQEEGQLTIIDVIGTQDKAEAIAIAESLFTE